MKTLNFFIVLAVFSAAMLFSSCENNTVEPQGDYGILPENFMIDVPGSLTSSTVKSAIMKNAEGDTLNGNEIYEHLRNFIAIGEAAGTMVEAIIWNITIHKIDQVKSLTFVSDEDNRVKNMVVSEGIEYGDRIWEYSLTITDAESEGNEDGGKGLQIFWNKSPIAGIAIFKPYNINRRELSSGEAMFSIEYSEAGNEAYDAYMIVDIAGLPRPDRSQDPFAVDNLKMFVGKKGDIIDVYGNSNHPNAQFFTENTGFNWAFVASGYDEANIAVAEVGLPSSLLDTDSREILLEEYSFKNVLTEEVNTWFLDNFGIRPDSTDLAAYLKNAEAPGFFNNGGFVQGGTAPSEDYNELLTRIDLLTPYNPKYISELSISFK